jgi:hypothetical protein
MDSVERWVSPDGQRIVLVDHRTGETWLMRRLPPGEEADFMTLLSAWSRLSPPEGFSPQSLRSFGVLK